MFFGYSLKLDQRTLLLEKKNGKEETKILTQQRQIDQLKARINQLEADTDILHSVKKYQPKADSKKHHDPTDMNMRPRNDDHDQ